MKSSADEIFRAFNEAAANEAIVSARFAVLDSAHSSFAGIADISQTAGWIQRNNQELSVALLARLASELAAGMSLLIRQMHTFPAGALLRQMVEIEYLMFLGYLDEAQFERWYRAEANELRSEFSPQRMRNASGGMFRDLEYWQHCELGGHPHPKSRVLLSQYNNDVPPQAFILPDAVHHLRRFWTSLKLVLARSDYGESAYSRHVDPLEDAIHQWTQVENHLILSFHGLAVDLIESSSK